MKILDIGKILSVARGSGAGGKKILLVDDDRDFAAAVSALLADAYEVTVAHDGVSALKSAKSGAYALVILDVNLPDINGFRICRSLKEEEKFSGKILMLTIRGTSGDLKLGEGAGADAYVQKPIDNALFLETVGSLISS